MTKNRGRVIIVVLSFCLLYAAIVMIGLATHQLLRYMCVVNAVYLLGGIYSTIKEKEAFKGRKFDYWKPIVFVEGLLFLLSVYAVLDPHLNIGFAAVQYVLFGIITVAAILMLVFLLLYF